MAIAGPPRSGFVPLPGNACACRPPVAAGAGPASRLPVVPMDRDEHRSFGVFKPVGHVVISFPSAEHASRAADEIGHLDLGDGAITRFSDEEMRRQIDDDLAQAGVLAQIGQEWNLVQAQRELALRGYHFLVVRAPDDANAMRVAEAARRCGAERAQSYGRFIIEELIERPGALPQVGESPARGLDAQTPSGTEAEAADASERKDRA